MPCVLCHSIYPFLYALSLQIIVHFHRNNISSPLETIRVFTGATGTKQVARCLALIKQKAWAFHIALNSPCSIQPVDIAGINLFPDHRCKVQAIFTLSVKTASPLPGNAKASVLTIILGNQAKCFPLLIVPKKWIFYVNIGVIEAKDRLLRQPFKHPIRFVSHRNAQHQRFPYPSPGLINQIGFPRG